MFSLFNNIIIKTIPFIPKSVIRIISNRYIAGTNDNDAIETIRSVNDRGLLATIDILGEHTVRDNIAENITNNYIELFNKIKANKLNCNISIKPSHIGSDINNKTFNKNLQNIHEKASECNNFLRLDMESSKLTDYTIGAFKKRYEVDKNIGIVIQAYLHRSIKDIEKLNEGMNIRLCKGIYNESSKISFKNPEDINKNYLKLLKKALKNKIYVGIATHDTTLIQSAIRVIDNLEIEKKCFEFQVLYGVPMGNTINYLLENNYKTRVYIPYGMNWYDYSIRRIKENPNISKYVIKNLFNKNFYK